MSWAFIKSLLDNHQPMSALIVGPPNSSRRPLLPPVPSCSPITFLLFLRHKELIFIFLYRVGNLNSTTRKSGVSIGNWKKSQKFDFNFLFYYWKLNKLGIFIDDIYLD